MTDPSVAKTRGAARAMILPLALALAQFIASYAAILIPRQPIEATGPRQVRARNPRPRNRHHDVGRGRHRRRLPARMNAAKPFGQGRGRDGREHSTLS